MISKWEERTNQQIKKSSHINKDLLEESDEK